MELESSLEIKLEIHGNEATIIEIEGGKEADPIIARILSIVTTENGKNMIIATDNQKNIYNINDFSNSTSICVEGDVMSVCHQGLWKFCHIR